MNYKKILLTLVLVSTMLNLLAQRSNGYLATADKDLLRIKAPLDSFNRRLPVEKVYLHTDKPYYNIGDTLWFKAYLLDRVNLTASKLSGLLYVELDDDSAQMVRRISIPIKEGLGWAQIPLTKAIFHEGGYTLRAYTNWMQNFGEDYVFSQRFYLGVPASDAWLVKSAATISRTNNKDQLNVELKLSKADKFGSAVGIKKVEVRIYDQDHYIYKEELQTGIDGSLKFSRVLKERADSRRIRLQLTSLEPADNNKVLQVPLTINRIQNIDLQFLPEGGSLVAGLTSIVGFKALADDGHGIPVLGDIYNGRGDKVATFTTMHNGMGSFEFTPKAGEIYTARLSQPVVKSFELPKISANGTVMHVVNTEQSNTVKVSLKGLASLPADSAYFLIGTSRGQIYYSQKVELSQGELTINKRLFPSGIARLTFFKNKTPLNQRAIFIDNHDELNIRITPNQSTYKKRDSVCLSIEVKDKSGFPVQGSFSLAVTDDSQVRPDTIGNFSINTSILLNSDLKGTVEDPGYYINRKDKQAWQALDNLMLTQGWTGYDWKDVFAPAKPPAFEAVKEFKITGRVTTLLNKPVKQGFSVLISSQKPSFYATAYTDEDGRYTFKNLPSIDSGSFFLQAKNTNGKSMSFGNINVDNNFKAPPIPETLRDPILPWYVNPDTVQLNYVKLNAERNSEKNIRLNGIVLKEVKIKSKKIIPGSANRNGSRAADLAFDEEDIKESAVLNLYELLKQKLPGLKVVEENRMPTLKLNNNIVVIHIDGGGLDLFMGANPTVEELIEELSQYQIATFKGMEVYYSEKNMVNYLEPRNSWINRHFTGDEIAKSEMAMLGGKWFDSDGNPWGLSQTPTNKPILNGWVYKVGYKPGYLEARANVFTNKTPDFASIDITTKNGNGWFKNNAPSAVTYRPLPVMRPLQFYRPKYNMAPGAVIEPDYRSTIHWEPNISTDQNGKAKVSFYTSDIAGAYTVTVAGADVTGWIGDAQIKINPQKP